MKQLVLGIAVILCLGSCNTIIGMGRDIKQLGDGMENTAHGRKWDGSEATPQENLPTY